MNEHIVIAKVNCAEESVNKKYNKSKFARYSMCKAFHLSCIFNLIIKMPLIGLQVNDLLRTFKVGLTRYVKWINTKMK